jgi:hypothetical protein
MAKPKAKAPRVPKVGDKVIPPNSELVYTVFHVSKDGTEVDLDYDDSNLRRFRVPVASLKWSSR